MHLTKGFFRKLFFLSTLLSLHHFLAAAPITSLDNDAQSESDSTPFTMFYVPVGDENNVADPLTSYGSVQENFQIGTCDVTANQYCAFLNHVASTDTYGLYNTNMGSDQTIACIQQTGTSGSYQYQVIEGRGDFPITYVDWFCAARFCNWVHNGQLADPTTTETGAYSLNGATNGSIIAAEENATCFLPNENQWYKAAYYQGNAVYSIYPTGSDNKPDHVVGDLPNQANYATKEQYASAFNFTQPYFVKKYTNLNPPYLTPVKSFTGSPTHYGAYDMGGDVNQWIASSDGPEEAIVRGGDWDHFSNAMKSTSRTSIPTTCKSSLLGFRVAAPALPILECTQSNQAPEQTTITSPANVNVPQNQNITGCLSLATTISPTVASDNILGTIMDGLRTAASSAWRFIRTHIPFINGAYEPVPDFPPVIVAISSTSTAQ